MFDLIDGKNVIFRKLMIRILFIDKIVVCLKIDVYGNSEVVGKEKLDSILFLRKIFIVVVLELGMDMIIK